MERTRALEIIKALADGYNPYTGEVFEGDSVFQNPDTVRALHIALEAVNRIASHERKKSQLPENAGKTWTQEEEEEVLKSFEAGMSIREIADKHGRTKGSIESKLDKHGKLPYALVTRYRERKPESIL